MSIVFDDFHLDVKEQTLSRRGNIVPLTPKAFALLRYFVESGGRLVLTTELLAAVWPGLVVSDSALKVCVSEVRRVLGDNPKSPKYIQTVHKRGYRFIRFIGIGELENARAELVHSRPSVPFSTSNSEVLQGREDVLARLESILAKTCQSERCLVFVSGDPGIGKTSTVNAFSERVRTSGRTYICHGQCINHTGHGEAYLPLLDAISHLARQEDGEKIVAILARYAPSWVMQLPVLLEKVKDPAFRKPAGEISRERMLREMAEALEFIAAHKPLVLVLEDLHWSDSATIDLLSHIFHRNASAALMVVGTYRPMDVVIHRHPLMKFKQSLLAHGRCVEIPLELLQVQAIQEYLEERFPNCKGLSELAQTVYRQSEGNPLFMVNITAYLVDRGLITECDGVWQARNDLTVDGIPENLRDVIDQQLDYLDDVDQDLLKIMSVCGLRPAIVEISAASGLSAESIELRCENLMQNSLFIRFRDLEERPDGSSTGRFEFNHALYQNVLYEKLPPLRRLRLHLDIGKSLEKAYGDRSEERAVQLAEHFTHGHDFVRAIHFWLLAAETSVKRQAYREAVAHLEQGLRLVERITDEPLRLQLELTLHMTLGPVLIARKGNAAPEVKKIYQRARELCEKLRDDSKLFPVLFGLRSYYQFSGQLETAHTYSRQLWEVGNRTGNDDHRLEAVVALASTHYYLGDLKNSLKFAQEGIEIYDPNRHRSHVIHYGTDPGVFCLSRYAQVSWMMGFPARALLEINKAIALGESIDHPYSLVFAIHNATQIYLYRLDAELALASAVKGKCLAGQHGFGFLIGWASYLMAWALAISGKKREALKELQDALALPMPESKTTRDYLQVFLAEIYYHLEMPNPGLKTLKEVTPDDQEFTYRGERYRLKAEFLLRNGNNEEAESYLVKSVQRNADIGAISYQLRAALTLARLWMASGRQNKARALLRDCSQAFSEAEPVQELNEAIRLMEKADLLG